MPDHSPSNIDEQIECVEREIKQRKRVYPRWVEQEKMTQALADRELSRMSDVLSTLKAVKTLVVAMRNDLPWHDMKGLCGDIAEWSPLPPQGSLM